MIVTLFATILIEGIVVWGYSIRRKKPIVSILLTSMIANLLTQSLLWIGLNVFFDHYRIALFVFEIAIWGIESIFLCRIPSNQLDLMESLLLSLMMNLSSFVFGLIVPV